jgi:lipoprotein-anchoring transpeptidase ErfK/SrfK
MQRSIVTTLLLSVAGTVSAFAQPMPRNGYYYPQAPAAQPYYQQGVAQPPPYPQQQYAQRPYAQPQYQQQQYARPQYAQPQYAQPQPQYAQPQYAQPQPQYAQPQAQYAEPQRGSMGGGFIEYIFSGGQSRFGRGQLQTAPQQGYVPEQQAYVPAQPMYGQPAQVMQASLPPQRLVTDPRYLKQVVDYDGKEPPGSIIINTPDKFLYLVQEDGKALRYGIGVGREGFTWRGTESISGKREWPDWRPPKEMLQRRPDLPHYMAGGPENPLGARALYLGSTLYRIHGSNEPWTIGTQVSSGCIRMRNEDVIDLYERVKVGTKVTVI